MDKFIYRGVVILVCLVLIIVLIAAPVMAKIYIDIKRAEVRRDKDEAQTKARIEQLERMLNDAKRTGNSD